MTTNIGKAPQEWRNYSTRIPIPAFRMKRDDLRRLYQIANEKQIEYRDKVLGFLTKQSSESDDEFAARRQRVHDAFVTSITVTAVDGEMVHANDEALFDSPNMPEQLRSILISTQPGPQYVLGFAPLCNVVIYLDFSRPPLLDFSRLPTLPTPNESNFSISADNESWFSAVRARLIRFFSDRRTAVNWLHSAAIYDILLIFIGIPMAIWTDYRAVGTVPTSAVPPIVLTGAYVYVFFAALNLFRALFSYSRWVFPKVELESEWSSPFRHRGVWSAILLAVIASFLYDLLKTVF